MGGAWGLSSRCETMQSNLSEWALPLNGISLNILFARIYNRIELSYYQQENQVCETANKLEQIDNWICKFNPGLKCGEEENPCGFFEGAGGVCTDWQRGKTLPPALPIPYISSPLQRARADMLCWEMCPHLNKSKYIFPPACQRDRVGIKRWQNADFFAQLTWLPAKKCLQRSENALDSFCPAQWHCSVLSSNCNSSQYSPTLCGATKCKSANCNNSAVYHAEQCCVVQNFAKTKWPSAKQCHWAETNWLEHSKRKKSFKEPDWTFWNTNWTKTWLKKTIRRIRVMMLMDICRCSPPLLLVRSLITGLLSISLHIRPYSARHIILFALQCQRKLAVKREEHLEGEGGP